MSYNIDSSDTDDGSLDLQGSASDIDVSQVFVLPSLTSFCEVSCFKILTIQAKINHPTCPIIIIIGLVFL